MKYDVVVVGAGPAGATAAKVLTEKGIHVLLIDKETFPRDKPCGGGLPVRVLTRYPYLEQHHLIDSHSSSIRVHSPSQQHIIDVKKNETVIAMVLRNTFDSGLVNLAIQSGAEFLGGKRVASMMTDRDRATVSLEDGTIIETSYIIAADGMWSTLAKQLGEPQSNEFTGVCAVEEYKLGEDAMDQLFGVERCIHIHLSVLGIAGYGWVFPKKEHVNIGLCEFRHALSSPQEKKNLKTLYGQYIDLLKEHNVIPQTLQIKNVKGGVFPTRPLLRTYGTRTVLCGDAAGLTNPLTGEGIYYAMVSGEIAAKVLNDAISYGWVDESALARYQRGWKKEFGNDFPRYLMVSKRWKLQKDNLVRLLGSDQKIIDTVLTVVMKPVSLKTIRWKVARRFIYLYLRDRLRR